MINHKFINIIILINGFSFFIITRGKTKQQYDVDCGKCQDVTHNHLVNHDHKRTGDLEDSEVEEEMQPATWNRKDHKMVLNMLGSVHLYEAKRDG